MLERLQKIIARAGIASRRHAEELIASGLVTVNGRTITELGTKADESRDHIKVSGKLLRPESERIYLLLNKPPEVVSTLSDPEGRPSLRDFLQGVSERVFPVGRLEYHSSGLVFLTNDGELASRIFQSHHLPQTYAIKLKSLLTFAEIEQLARSTGARISRLKGKEAPWYEVTLTESRRDALRNRLFQTGHPVERMKRVRIANLGLDRLAPGEHRVLSSSEVSAFSRALSSPGAPTPATAAFSRFSAASERARAPRPSNNYSRRKVRPHSTAPYRGNPGYAAEKRDSGARRETTSARPKGPRSTRSSRHEPPRGKKTGKPAFKKGRPSSGSRHSPRRRR
ncbi:MAG: pseudouridine synthase [Candidatus Acidiferrales bacterium]